MTQSLKLGEASAGTKIRQLNRLPIFIAIALVVTFFAVIFYGLSSRGLRFGDGQTAVDGSGSGSPILMQLQSDSTTNNLFRKTLGLRVPNEWKR